MLQSYQEVLDRCEQLKAHPFHTDHHLHSVAPERLSPEEQETRREGIELTNKFLLDVMPAEAIGEDHPDLPVARVRVAAVLNLTELDQDNKQEAPAYYAGIWDQESDVVKSVIAVRTALQIYKLQINGLLLASWGEFVKKAKLAMIDG